MPITAKYIIYDSFQITGHGIVFAGTIMEGDISRGDIIEFEAMNFIYQREIVVIEEMTFSQPSKVNTGLLIKCDSEEEIMLLKNWKPEREVAVIYRNAVAKKGMANAERNSLKRRWAWLRRIFAFEK
jgi:hypothetical protein